MQLLLRFLFSLLALAAAVAWADEDPPGRAGRISFVSGTVHLRGEPAGEIGAAMVNWPVTAGVGLATEPGARAELRIGSTAVRLDGDTDLEVAALDEDRLRLRLLHGTVAVRVRDPEHASQFELFTAQGRAALGLPGAYRFDAGRPAGTTAVTVFQGAADFSGEGLSLAIPAGSRAEIFGDGRLEYVFARAAEDEFDAWSAARDRRDDEIRSTRYLSPETTGYEELDAHYGGWVVLGGRWAWVPHHWRAHPRFKDRAGHPGRHWGRSPERGKRHWEVRPPGREDGTTVHGPFRRGDAPRLLAPPPGAERTPRMHGQRAGARAEDGRSALGKEPPRREGKAAGPRDFRRSDGGHVRGVGPARPGADRLPGRGRAGLRGHNN